MFSDISGGKQNATVIGWFYILYALYGYILYTVAHLDLLYIPVRQQTIFTVKVTIL